MSLTIRVKKRAKPETEWERQLERERKNNQRLLFWLVLTGVFLTIAAISMIMALLT